MQPYTTVSAIRPTSLLRRLVHLDMLDDQVPRVEALGVGVGLGVLEQAEEELGGFDGPTGFGDAELFAYFPPRQNSLAPPAIRVHCPNDFSPRFLYGMEWGR